MRFPAVRGPLTLLLALLAAMALACTDESARPEQSAAPLYVAIGASDSVGTGARSPASEGWVTLVYQKMPAGTRLANLGINGLQLRQALDQVLPVALDLRPTVVTVWLAVNDYAAGVPLAAYRDDLDTLLDALAQGTRARVYVANLPDLTLLPRFGDRPPDALRADVAQWNAAIAAAAAAHGATLIDLFADWGELRDHPEYISRDGLHPSSRGHRRLAEIVWRAMGNGQ
jgi:acyl-CoA thioesterase-1